MVIGSSEGGRRISGSELRRRRGLGGVLDVLEMLELREVWALLPGEMEDVLDVEEESAGGVVDVAGGEVEVTVERVSMGCIGTLLRCREGRRGGVEDMAVELGRCKVVMEYSRVGSE